MPILRSCLVLRLGASLKQARQHLSCGVHPAVGIDLGSRCFSDSYNKSNTGGSSKFQPQRRPNRKYRPIVPRVIKPKGPRPADQLMENPAKQIVDLDDYASHSLNDLAQYGPRAQEALEYLNKTRDKRGKAMTDIDMQFRTLDYYTANYGSTEDLVGQRRALAADIPDPKERAEFLQELEQLIDRERFRQFDIQEDDYEDIDDEEEYITEEDHELGIKTLRDKKLRLLAEEEMRDDSCENDVDDLELMEEEEDDETIIVKGQWGAQLITVDFVQKPQKGGRKGSFRALAIGGNGNGCGGFGIGKADTMDRAIMNAVRLTRKNPVFVERWKGGYLTRDLVGKHNSCIVKIFAHSGDNTLRGNELIQEILLHCGVACGMSKAFYTATPYNVVIATFKALMTHESMEEIAFKRGARLITLERARRLQV